MPLDNGQVAALEALTARIFPGGPDGPGAPEAGAVGYILRLLDGADDELRGLYSDGLAALDQRGRRLFGCAFADLPANRQDALLAGLSAELDQVLGTRRLPGDTLLRFFALACEHTLQGVLCDPVHGGNTGAVGWRLIGFPGVQWGYTARQMRPGFDAATIPVRTLADWAKLAD